MSVRNDLVPSPILSDGPSRSSTLEANMFDAGPSISGQVLPGVWDVDEAGFDSEHDLVSSGANVNHP